MSNRVTIEPTKFENSRNGSITYGYRAYDDHNQTYCNTMESIPDDDLDFLQAVLSNGTDEVLSGMLDYIFECNAGINIGGSFYEYDKIKEMIEVWE